MKRPLPVSVLFVMLGAILWCSTFILASGIRHIFIQEDRLWLSVCYSFNEYVCNILFMVSQKLTYFKKGTLKLSYCEVKETVLWLALRLSLFLQTPNYVKAAR